MWWLVAWVLQAITWANVLLSAKSWGQFHWQWPRYRSSKYGKTTCLKLLPFLKGDIRVNEMTPPTPIPPTTYVILHTRKLHKCNCSQRCVNLTMMCQCWHCKCTAKCVWERLLLTLSAFTTTRWHGGFGQYKIAMASVGPQLIPL